MGVRSALKSPSIFVFFLVNEPVSNVSDSGNLKLSICGKLFLIKDYATESREFQLSLETESRIGKRLEE